ncbi:hypothetical protein ACH5RR_038425 [Cinchona calisaya]|uniref:Uncharacterized protein n=1 Tax=Cinchona calisaya TaxID=153742 RepID=A0ABD2XV88_9GENT
MAESKEEDVNLGANESTERQPKVAATQTQREKDYKKPPPAPLFEPGELCSWSFYRAGIAEFMATLLFLYIIILTIMGFKRSQSMCASVEGHINPAVTFGLFLARKLTLTRAVFYIVMQCLGATCGAGIVKGFHEGLYEELGGGVNVVSHGYTLHEALVAEVIGTFVLVYIVFYATDAKRFARDSHVPILAPLLIGFAVFLVHLATIPITGTGINPARCFGAAVIFNKYIGWKDHAMDLLVWTLHWSCPCCILPPDSQLSHSYQENMAL